MHIELAATHEAGHAVMQWLVGWEFIDLQMTARDSDATHVSARCPHPAIETLAALRKRLLVLFAGNAATRERWPTSNNDWGDWNDVIKAVGVYFAGVQWFVADGRRFRDPKINTVVQVTIAKTAEIMANLFVRQAMTQIATAFTASTAGEDGVVRLDGREAVATCEAVIGPEFRLTNPWSAWIAEKDGELAAETIS